MRSRPKGARRPNFSKNISDLEKRGGAAWSMLPFRRLVVIVLLINLSTGIAALLIQKNLPPEIPLYFGLPQGPAQLTSSIGLIIPVAISLSVAIINVTLTLFIPNEYLKKVLVIASVGLTFFSVITILKIAQLVGSF
jgi:hypothetical protein